MAAQQKLLNRSEVFLNGKPFGLALGVREPFDLDTLERSVSGFDSSAPERIDAAPDQPSPSKSAPRGGGTAASMESHKPGGTAENRKDSENRQMPSQAGFPPHPELSAVERVPQDPAAPQLSAELDGLQKKYQARIDDLAAEGLAKHHFVGYAPPSFVLFRGRIAMQLTLKNPTAYDRDGSSIYRRAAQSFDLFLAPQLKPILDKVPDAPELSALDVTVIDELSTKSGASSEAVEYVLPLDLLRRFVSFEVTNQELIDHSTVLINGVRIALTLQLVE